MTKFKIVFAFLLIFVFVFAFQIDLTAQCPMCRMTAESNMANGGSAGRGLNNGILYIFVMPYILVSVIGYIWWKNNRKKVKQSDESLN